MAVSRLTLTDFRNYSDTIITPAPGINVLTGDNGAGKTNILEALSLLAPGRGLRGAALGEMARIGSKGGFAIVGDIGANRIGVGTLAMAPERRVVRIDGATASATSLAERIALIWVTPQMDRLFADTASDRRRFLDRLVLAIEPQHASETARYDAAMRQRNRLLAADIPPDPAWLDALEYQMEVHGRAVMAARMRLIEAVAEQMAAQEAGPFARADLAIDGWRPDPGFAQRLARQRSADAAARRTGEGPHRADLVVTHYAKQQPASRCSTGEQKALLLSIVLAHARLVASRRGVPPILLLDEVAAHLDAARRAALLSRIAALGGQAWLTGTDATLFADAPKDCRHFHVDAGAVHPG